MITAMQLVEIANREVVTPGYAASRPDWVGGERILKATIHEAVELMLADSMRAQERIAKINTARTQRLLEKEIGVKGVSRSFGWDKPAPNLTWDDEAPAQPAASAKAKREVCRVLIFGKYPTTAVIRWCGKHGWDFEDTACALAGLGAAKISDITIKLQLKAGKEGERGEPAPLTKSEIKQLEELGRG